MLFWHKLALFLGFLVLTLLIATVVLLFRLDYVASPSAINNVFIINLLSMAGVFGIMGSLFYFRKSANHISEQVSISLRGVSECGLDVTPLTSAFSKAQQKAPSDVNQEGGDATGPACNPLLLFSVAQHLRGHLEILANIAASLPGGVVVCRWDEYLSIHYASNGFVESLGYQLGEIEAFFDNKFINILCPDDRGRLRQVMQTQPMENFELELRLISHSSRKVWTLLRGTGIEVDGELYFYFVLVNINELQSARQTVQVQEQKFRIALCATYDYVFESGPDNSFFSHKGEWTSLLGCHPEIYLQAWDLAKNLCHADDIEIFNEVFNPHRIVAALGASGETLVGEFRLLNLDSGEYVWFRHTVVAFLADDGSLEKFFGCIVNIDVSKQAESKMIYSAQRDSLTGLLNKGTMEQEVSRALGGSGGKIESALMVIDLDNFKSINDNLGHLFGDAVLCDAANSLKKIFRSSDLVGRIGGDEFLVLLRDVKGRELVELKAADVCAALDRGFSGESRDYCLSGSVGIAMFPADGVHFRELFKKADMALYSAKHAGKGRTYFYSDISPEEAKTLSLMADSGLIFRTVIDSQATTK